MVSGVPSWGSPASASTWSMRTNGQASSTRRFQAASSRAVAYEPPSASARTDAAAGAYSVVT